MGRIAIVVAFGVIGLPQSAATQARGSVQATAIVVDMRVSYSSLEGVRHALQPSINRRPANTVAELRVERRKNNPRDLIVTIEYSRN